MKNLNENDKDLRLARKINELIEENGLNKSAGQDESFLAQLIDYRLNKEKKLVSTSVPSARIWKMINDGINKQTEATIYKLNIRQKALLWASIAAIVLITIISIDYFSSGKKAVLLASSENTVQYYTFPDGSHVSLRPHSNLYLEHQSKTAQIFKLKGEGFFKVIHNPNRKFIVHAGQGEVTDLGTEFDVSDWGENTQVYVQKGSVSLRSIKIDKSVKINSGEFCFVSEDGHLSQPEQRDKSQYLDWLNDELNFNHQKVSSVFSELEHHYNITIDVPDTNVNDTTISGQIHLDNLSHSLNDLAIVLGGKFIKIKANTYRFLVSK